jgi:hypothetical protein
MVFFIVWLGLLSKIYWVCNEKTVSYITSGKRNCKDSGAKTIIKLGNSAQPGGEGSAGKRKGTDLPGPAPPHGAVYLSYTEASARRRGGNGRRAETVPAFIYYDNIMKM